MKRRLRRIYPPYWAALTIPVAVYIHHAWPSPERTTFLQTVGNLTLTETWLSPLAGQSSRLMMLQAWTLVYEEQFYLTAAILLLLSARWYLPATIALCALSGIGAYANTTGLAQLGGLMISGPWVMFAAGAFLFYAIHGLRHEKIASGIGLLVCAVIGCSLIGVNEHYTAAGLFAILAWPLYRWDKAIANLPWLRSVQWLGVISYSLYLTHSLPCGIGRKLIIERFHLESPLEEVVVVMPLCVAASLLLAWPFHVFVERRFMPGAKS